jgi:putative transcriptional regulator
VAIKNRLKEIRHDYRMNQIEFAEYLGVSQSLYNRWEKQRNQPTTEMVLRVSKRLNLPVESIVCLVEES